MLQSTINALNWWNSKSIPTKISLCNIHYEHKDIYHLSANDIVQMYKTETSAKVTV